MEATLAHSWGGTRRSRGMGPLVEFDLDQRTVADHPVQVVSLPRAGDVRQDLAALGLVVDHARDRRQVGPRPALQVKCEVRVGLEVQQPLALPRIGRAADVRPPMLWNTISSRRASPLLRPFVVMSIVCPRSSAASIASFVTATSIRDIRRRKLVFPREGWPANAAAGRMSRSCSQRARPRRLPDGSATRRP